MAPDDELALAETFAELARTLLGEGGAQATLDRIVRLAVVTIDHCEHAGISRIEGRKVYSPAASDAIPALVDKLQSETGEGPCLDAIREHKVFWTGHLSQEGRWPTFVARARAESGIESILSLRLYAEEDTMGALNLYSAAPDAFDEHDLAVASIFATHAAVALSAAEHVENLQNAVESRQLIGVATGLLMARQDISEAQAFELMRRASQRLNIKLRSVADQIVNPRTRPAAGAVPPGS